MPVTTQALKGWLKYANNMKLSLDASVLRLTHEGITNFTCLSDFDKKSIQDLPNIYKKSIPVIYACASNNIGAEAAVSGANISYILVSRLATAVNTAKHYGFIARVMNPQNMKFLTVLATFKVYHEACVSEKYEDDTKVPKINDMDNDCNVIS